MWDGHAIYCAIVILLITYILLQVVFLSRLSMPFKTFLLLENNNDHLELLGRVVANMV